MPASSSTLYRLSSLYAAYISSLTFPLTPHQLLPRLITFTLNPHTHSSSHPCQPLPYTYSFNTLYPLLNRLLIHVSLPLFPLNKPLSAHAQPYSLTNTTLPILHSFPPCSSPYIILTPPPTPILGSIPILISSISSSSYVTPLPHPFTVYVYPFLIIFLSIHSFISYPVCKPSFLSSSVVQAIHSNMTKLISRYLLIIRPFSHPF